MEKILPFLKEKKYYVLFFLGGILFFLFPYFCIFIELHGEKEIVLEYKQEYQEQGASASFLGIPLKVSKKGEIDSSKLGEQKVSYLISNRLGVMKKKTRKVYVKDLTPPVLKLLGEEVVTLNVGEPYKEAGFTLKDDVDGDLTNSVVVENTVDINKVGTYEILYMGEDKSKNQVTKKRTVHIIEEMKYLDSYDDVDNLAKTWWTGNKSNHERPEFGAGATEEELKPYDAYYMGPDGKVIYLTFDEGSNDTYVEEIVDVLNKNDVKATFFFCKTYIVTNPDLMKKIVNSGHSVGNHTQNHEAMYQYASKNRFKTFIEEIQSVEQAFYEATGKSMDKVYREPAGNWSYRDLQIIKDMGYKSYFWSADYYDFAYDSTKEHAYQSLLAKYHNGAIYLIHPKNKGNYEALDDFIKTLKELGYRFDLVKNIK